MNAEILRIVGAVAGIAGIGLGVLLIVFREIIRKRIFPTLTRKQGFILLLTLAVLVWSTTIAAIGAWVYSQTPPIVTPTPTPESTPKDKDLTYQGFIVDADTLKPIRKASVTLVDKPDLSPQVTDSLGRFVFKISTGGDLFRGKVLIQHDEYNEWDKLFDLTPDSPPEYFQLSKKNKNPPNTGPTVRPSIRPGKIDLAVSVKSEKRPIVLPNAVTKNPELLRSNQNDSFRKNLWTNGSTLRIKFLDGEQPLKEKVAAVAREWTRYANLVFDFNDSPDAQIRISFRQPGSWSYLGTQSLTGAPNTPTMNFGGLSSASSDEEISRTVLHEFGHGLGLVNELESPNANIPWNKQAVYEYFVNEIGWTREAVDNRFFVKTSNYSYRDFDPKSIMADAVPASLTTNGFQIGFNNKLSEGDKRWIAELYPR